MSMDLKVIRRKLTAWHESFHDHGQGFGRYIPPSTYGRDTRPQAGYFYASADIAILRAITGEDLSITLSTQERTQWLAYLNSFQDPSDGSYQVLAEHSRLHAHGTAVGAIGVLGGNMTYPVTLYEPFDTADKVVPWLESAIDWSAQWSSSHLFWGGVHCFSLSSRTTTPWLDRVFHWLDDNLDDRTGWWRRGTPHADRHQGLGGCAHILPLYQHHHRKFPCAHRLVDSVLALQLPQGNWFQGMDGLTYLDLDGLYVLEFCKPFIGDYRSTDIAMSVQRFSNWLQIRLDQIWFSFAGVHPHMALCLVGTLGLLQRLDPAHYTDDRAWADIFSSRHLYQAADIEPGWRGPLARSTPGGGPKVRTLPVSLDNHAAL